MTTNPTRTMTAAALDALRERARKSRAAARAQKAEVHDTERVLLLMRESLDVLSAEAARDEADLAAAVQAFCALDDDMPEDKEGSPLGPMPPSSSTDCEAKSATRTAPAERSGVVPPRSCWARLEGTWHEFTSGTASCGAKWPANGTLATHAGPKDGEPHCRPCVDLFVKACRGAKALATVPEVSRAL